MMDYPQTLDYLYTQLPMFTRVGASAFKKDLTNTIALCNLLGNPQQKFRSIHVGGTNGKGSTSHMLAAVLQTAGYKTGLYTSPHLKDFRERIRINGEMISEDEVVNFVAQHRSDFEQIQPSFFEMTVALAFDAFARHEVYIAVIEVGLGGRLDSTNIITPLLSVITNIGYDHMNLLGDTLPEIAAEKAGIIKPGIPVIIGEYQPEIASVFLDRAQQAGSSLRFASQEWEAEAGVESSKFDVQNYDDDLLKVEVKNTESERSLPNLSLDLTGSYQLKNIETVLSVVEELRTQGFTITDEQLTAALRQVKALTGLQGRWQTLSHHPLTICDTGHNAEGIQEVLKNIAAILYDRLHVVIGMVNDKDISKVLGLLPKDAHYYFCRPDIPRGLEADVLQQQALALGLQGNVYTSVGAALQAAQQQAGPNDLVFAGGSTFVVAEIV